MTLAPAEVPAPNMVGESMEENFLLEPDVLAMLSRKNRHRLREIQSSSQASLKLDRQQGVLQVKGSPAAVADVRRQLQLLRGSPIAVPAAVWVELMRTRINPETSEAAVARIQQQSDCRIHIERSSLEIRLFGLSEDLVAGRRLIEELGAMCMEERVDMECPSYLNSEMLQAFAEEFGVTLLVEDKSINVIGIAEAVVEAAQELRKYETGKQPLTGGREVGKSSVTACAAIKMALLKLKGDENNNSTEPSSSGTDNDSAALATDALMQGATLMVLPPPASEKAPKAHKQPEIKAGTEGSQKRHQPECPTCGCANFCVHCGNRTEKINGAGCPTCHAAKFCIYCGTPSGSNFKVLQGGGFGGASQVYNQTAMMPAQLAPTAPHDMQYRSPEPAPMMCIPMGASPMRAGPGMATPYVMQDPRAAAPMWCYVAA